MKKSFKLFSSIALILVLALYSQVSNASTTTVTGTIHDPSGQVYANGNVTAEFVPAANYPSGSYTVGGVPFNKTVTGTLSLAGVFSINVTDSLSVAPALTTWRFKLCPNATSPCAFYIAPIGSVTGGAIDLSAAINAQVPNIVVQVSPNYIPAAYNSTEIVNPPAGALYWDLTVKCIKVYDSATTAWTCSQLSNNIKIANNYPGTPDLCAQINAADADLGVNAGEVWVFAGGNCLTQSITSSTHALELFEGTYTNALGEYLPPFLLKDNSSLICASWGTILQNSSNAADHENVVIAVYNATIGGSGGGIPNNSRAVSAGIVVRDCHFKDSGLGNNTSLTGTVALNNCSNCKVLNNWFEGIRSTHITLVGSSLDGFFGDTDEIANNVHNGATDAAISVINNRNVDIHDNLFHGHGNGAAAFIDLEGNLTTDYMQFIDIHNNIMDGTDALNSVYGVTCNSAGANQHDIKIHDNIIYGLNNGSNHLIQAIACGASGSPNSYTDVEIYNNKISYTVQPALSIGGMARANVHDNRIHCGSGPAIQVLNNTFDSVIQNNIFSAPLSGCASTTSNYRVLQANTIQELAGADRNLYKGNVASRVTTSGANSKVIDNITIEGNGKTERVPTGFTSLSGALPITQLAPPVLSVTPGAIGSCVLASGNYSWHVTAVDANGGETPASNGVSQNSGGGFGCTVLSWTSVPGAVSYNLYRALVSAPPDLFIANIADYSLAYGDLGGQTPGATYPATNNTGSIKATEGGVIGGAASSDVIWADSTGHCWKFNANNAGNSGCIPGIDIPQTWTGSQTFGTVVTTNLSMGGVSMTNLPLQAWGCFLPGNLTSTWTGCEFTPKKGIIVLQIEVASKTGPAGCGTNAVVRVTDGSNPLDTTINSAIVVNNIVGGQNYAANAVVQAKVLTAAAGCGTSPADTNVTIQYRMQ